MFPEKFALSPPLPKLLKILPLAEIAHLFPHPDVVDRWWKIVRHVVAEWSGNVIITTKTVSHTACQGISWNSQRAPESCERHPLLGLLWKKNGIKFGEKTFICWTCLLLLQSCSNCKCYCNFLFINVTLNFLLSSHGNSVGKGVHKPECWEFGSLKAAGPRKIGS